MVFSSKPWPILSASSEEPPAHYPTLKTRFSASITIQETAGGLDEKFQNAPLEKDRSAVSRTQWKGPIDVPHWDAFRRVIPDPHVA
jgi:hypothetical protein